VGRSHGGHSPAATLYAAWWSQLDLAARQALLPAEAQTLIETLHPPAVLRWLRGLIEADSHRDSPAWNILRHTLLPARERAQPGGNDPAPWGSLHRVNLGARCEHGCRARCTRSSMRTGGGSGGDGGTVHARWYLSFDRRGDRRRQSFVQCSTRATGAAHARSTFQARAVIREVPTTEISTIDGSLVTGSRYRSVRPKFVRPAR
jgi:hypothetical protein